MISQVSFIFQNMLVQIVKYEYVVNVGSGEVRNVVSELFEEKDEIQDKRSYIAEDEGFTVPSTVAGVDAESI